MRFMTIVKTRETGAHPSPALIEKIGKLGEDAAKTGVLVLEVEVRQMMDDPSNGC